MPITDWKERLRVAALSDAAARSADCAHEDAEIRRRVTSNGAYQFVEQCMTCGAARSQAIPHGDTRVRNAAAIADFDPDLSTKWREAIASTRSAGARWHQEYSEYLRSAEWGARRQLVLERESYLCEGCRTKHATHVHHSAGYGSAGHEPLFELRALCRGCHGGIHGVDELDDD